MKVNEIFYSIQGESAFSGLPCVFIRLTGCNLQCSYCDTKYAYDEGEEKSIDEIIQKVKTYNCNLVQITGGEPLLQIDYSYSLASRSKELGLHVTIDTAGYTASGNLMRIMPFVDLFLYDIKFINNELHKKYTGKSNNLILANFQKLCEAGKKVVVRVPLIPNISDQKKNLLQIEQFVRHCSDQVEIDYIPFNYLSFEKYRMMGKGVPPLKFGPRAKDGI